MRVRVYESSKVTGASESERSRVERRDVGGGRDVCVRMDIYIDGTEGKAEGVAFHSVAFPLPARSYFFTSPYRSP